MTKIIEKFSSLGLPLPKITTLGFGQCDETVLSSLAKVKNNEYIHLLNLDDDFKKIHDQIETMGIESELVKLFFDIGHLNQVFSIPVYQDNSPQIPEIIIPLKHNKPTTLAVDDKKLIIQVTDIDNVPIMTNTDRLLDVLSNVHTIINDESDISIKIKKLQQAQSDLSNFKNLSRDEEQSLQEINNEIKGYITDLQYAQTDQRMLTSIKTRANARQGFLSAPKSERQIAPTHEGSSNRQSRIVHKM